VGGFYHKIAVSAGNMHLGYLHFPQQPQGMVAQGVQYSDGLIWI